MVIARFTFALLAIHAVLPCAGCGERPPRVSYELEADSFSPEIDFGEVIVDPVTSKEVTATISKEIKARDHVRVSMSVHASAADKMIGFVSLRWHRHDDLSKPPKGYGGGPGEVTIDGDRGTVKKVIEAPSMSGDFDLVVYSRGNALAKTRVTVR